MAHHDHAADDRLALARPLVTQADRYQWQRAAARELAAILEEHADLPAIIWTIGSTGSLKGAVNGHAVGADARVTFEAWRNALQLGPIAEHPVSSGTAMHLRGSIHRAGVKVTVTASVPAESDEEPTEAATAALTPREATQPGPRSQPGQVSRRPRHNALEPLPGTRTRDSTARLPLPPPDLPEGPRPVHVR